MRCGQSSAPDLSIWSRIPRTCHRLWAAAKGSLERTCGRSTDSELCTYGQASLQYRRPYKRNSYTARAATGLRRLKGQLATGRDLRLTRHRTPAHRAQHGGAGLAIGSRAGRVVKAAILGHGALEVPAGSLARLCVAMLSSQGLMKRFAKAEEQAAVGL